MTYHQKLFNLINFLLLNSITNSNKQFYPPINSPLFPLSLRMQAKLTDHNLKLFSCQFHPSETIERVCTDPDTDRSLQCIECVLQNKSHLPKDKFCSLVEFIDDAVQQYTKIEHTLSCTEAPSSDLIDFLDYEESKIKTLANHVEKEKQKVNESFDSILQQLTSLCYSKRRDASEARHAGPLTQE